jgi:hypothetical protein
MTRQLVPGQTSDTSNLRHREYNSFLVSGLCLRCSNELGILTEGAAMIRAIMKTGKIQPLDELPEHWREGQKLIVEGCEPSGDPTDIKEWHDQFVALSARGRHPASPSQSQISTGSKSPSSPSQSQISTGSKSPSPSAPALALRLENPRIYGDIYMELRRRGRVLSQIVDIYGGRFGPTNETHHSHRKKARGKRFLPLVREALTQIGKRFILVSPVSLC